MSLFAKKAKPAPPTAPPVAPPSPPPLTPDFTKTDSSLKLDLPDVFAYDDHETKAKPASRRAKNDEDTASQARGTVLLVESNEEVCRLISRLLQHEGFAVLKASCLAEARIAMNDSHVDF